MAIHAADPARSERLQRVLALLRDDEEHSTLDITLNANTVAAATCISELRAGGYGISCVRRGKNYYYQLTDWPVDGLPEVA